MPPRFFSSHTFHGIEAGPRLIILGAVHGNETCGTRAIQRLCAEIESGALVLARGLLTLVPITNPYAYQRGERNGERNLNRKLAMSEVPQDYEDHLANRLVPLLGQHDILLDLHSFNAPGTPFIFLGPENNPGPLEAFARAEEEENWAVRLGPRRLIHGWLQTFANGVAARLAQHHADARASLINTDPAYGIGTTETMRQLGGIALTVECGQHADPAAPEVAYQAIRRTLAHFGLVDEAPPPCVDQPEWLCISQVLDKQDDGDVFARNWISFDALSAGEIVGTRAHGEVVKAPGDGFILFPNANTPVGNEWFYFASPSSRLLRRSV